MKLGSLLAGDVVTAACGLLGRRLVSYSGAERTALLIEEVEAYGGQDDPASHAYRGRTRRNSSMFGAPGTLYVYRSYGIHWCMNVVCGPPEIASAVLLRGGRALEGVDVMARRRGRTDHLTDGPGKLCQAMAVNADHDGSDVFSGPVTITGDPVGGVTRQTPRIGISKGVDRRWRFVLT